MVPGFWKHQDDVYKRMIYWIVITTNSSTGMNSKKGWTLALEEQPYTVVYMQFVFQRISCWELGMCDDEVVHSSIR